MLCERSRGPAEHDGPGQVQGACGEGLLRGTNPLPLGPAGRWGVEKGEGPAQSLVHTQDGKKLGLRGSPGEGPEGPEGALSRWLWALLQCTPTLSHRPSGGLLRMPVHMRRRFIRRNKGARVQVGLNTQVGCGAGRKAMNRVQGLGARSIHGKLNSPKILEKALHFPRVTRRGCSQSGLDDRSQRNLC